MVKTAVQKTAPSHLAKVHKLLNQHLCLVVEVSLHNLVLGHLGDPDWESIAPHIISGIHVVFTMEQSQQVHKWCMHGQIWPWIWDTGWKNA